MATTTEQKPNEQLERRDVEALTKLAGSLIRTPLELAERVRALQQIAHVLTPAVAVASIPAHIAINPVVVVIDTTFDPQTGRGNDVYFQKSIHKSKKVGGEYVPLEVSLNAKAIIRVLASSGVKITRSQRTDDGQKQNYWSWEACGDIREFDGSWRQLPHGNVEIDLRDGSAQIGEWNQDAWPAAERAAEERKKSTPPSEQWKVKADINGWSKDRVIGARKFGLRLAESKALNALGRNLGLKQIYTLEELKKPFVIFRAMWNPPNDPETQKMITAAELGATHMLGYPPALPPTAAATSPAPAEKTTATIQHAEDDVIEGQVADGDTAAMEEWAPEPEKPKAPAKPTFLVTAVKKQGDKLFALFKETGDQLHPIPESAAKVAHGAKSVAVPVYVERDAAGAITSMAVADEDGEKKL